MDETTGELLVEIRRGSYLESLHRVWACVARPDGEILHAVGDTQRLFPIRSLAKPFIAMELVRTGAADAFGLSDVELALASGSHDGEERHIAAVRAFLAKAELTADALLCGPAKEGRAIVGPPIANNCSGKHAGVLLLCRHLGLSVEDYIAMEHPVQQHLRPALLDAFDVRAVDAPPAIDGCGMPIFGVPLRDIAVAYARFGSSRDAAAVRIRAAMAAEPGYLGGWNGNFDTAVISWSGGAVLGKIGAEGLHADLIIGHGLGIAIKILDGNSRALPPVLALLLERVKSNAIPRARLAELEESALFNPAGRRVGTITLRHDVAPAARRDA